MPGAAVDLGNRDGGGVPLELVEIEREREPSSIKRLANDGAATPIPVSGDQAFLGQQIQGMPNRDAPNAQFLDQGVECRQTIARLPLASANSPAEHGGQTPVGRYAGSLAARLGGKTLAHLRATLRLVFHGVYRVRAPHSGAAVMVR